jgi:predicted house-cleaning noncanonical NTP pyrophosphatase (MazG superfamily)
MLSRHLKIHMVGAACDIVGKLVRDRIPEIMRAEGKSPDIEHVSGVRRQLALKDKLVEEAVELRDSDDIREELADVLEVTDALICAYGLDIEEIRAMQCKKRTERGGFEQGYYLKD